MAAEKIIDVLFGDVNPSGRLSVTFPQSAGQIPQYYKHMNTGRPLQKGKWFEKFRSNYLDVSNLPVYPFGYGLSYSKFSYGKVQLNRKKLRGNGTLTVTIPVTNKRSYDGKDEVQLYIRDIAGAAIEKVPKSLHCRRADKNGSVYFVNEDLKFYNAELKFGWEPGDFEIMVGTNSADVQTQMVHWEKQSHSYDRRSK